jgi:hypothetical protein
MTFKIVKSEREKDGWKERGGVRDNNEKAA